jgi:hypothetical protein
MPHIPIPPQMTVTQRLQALATNTNGVGVTNIVQPNSNVAQQIKDIAEQQARMVLDEWMKGHKDLFDSKDRKLRIQNISKLIGMHYDDRLKITGVIEEDKWYEFRLNNELMSCVYSIFLHRRQTDSGHYIMEYDSKTLWVTKDEIDTPEKIIICMNTI